MGDPGDGPEGLTGLSVVAFNWLEPASIVLAVGFVSREAGTA